MWKKLNEKQLPTGKRISVREIASLQARQSDVFGDFDVWVNEFSTYPKGTVLEIGGNRFVRVS